MGGIFPTVIFIIVGEQLSGLPWFDNITFLIGKFEDRKNRISDRFEHFKAVWNVSARRPDRPSPPFFNDRPAPPQILSALNSKGGGGKRVSGTKKGGEKNA